MTMLLGEVDIVVLDKDYMLRKIKPGSQDAEAILETYKNPLVAKYIPEELIPSDLESAIQIAEHYRNAARSGTMIYWAVARRTDDAMIGLIGFCDVDHYHKRAEIAYELNSEYWRRGIMYKAVKAVIKLMFETLSMKRVQANVMPDNIASISLLNKVGFVVEGVLSSYRLFRGAHVDVMMLGYSSEKYFRDKRSEEMRPVLGRLQKWDQHTLSHGEIVGRMRRKSASDAR